MSTKDLLKNYKKQYGSSLEELGQAIITALKEGSRPKNQTILKLANKAIMAGETLTTIIQKEGI